MLNKPFYKSKKFWLSVLGAILPFINKLAGIDLPTEELIAGVGTLATGIVAQGAVDYKAYKYIKYGEDVLGLAGKVAKGISKRKTTKSSVKRK